LDNRSKKKKCAVEGQANVSPVLPEEPVKNLKPLKKLCCVKQKHEKGKENSDLKSGRELNLDDMVPEVEFFSLFSGSVFNVECANEVSSPATQQAVEELKKGARKHSQLGK